MRSCVCERYTRKQSNRGQGTTKHGRLAGVVVVEGRWGLFECNRSVTKRVLCLESCGVEGGQLGGGHKGLGRSALGGEVWSLREIGA